MDSAKILDDIDTPISGVLAHNIQPILHRVIPLLELVVKPATGYTIEAVINDLLTQQTALWVIGDFNAITITRIQDRPTGRVLWNEWMAGENMDDWVADWMTVQEAFARSLGCAAIEFAGRNGYKRKYNPTFNNFRAIRTIFRCEL